MGRLDGKTAVITGAGRGIGAVMAIGNGLGGWLGARLTLAGGERVVRWAVIVAITGMIVKLIWFP